MLCRRVKEAAVGTQLGLCPEDSIQWAGRRGMRWGHLLHTLFIDGTVPGPPQVVVLHLRGDDLGHLKRKALIEQAMIDFLQIWRRWPGT